MAVTHTVTLQLSGGDPVSVDDVSVELDTSEETYIKWELADFNRAYAFDFGNSSPFGAQTYTVNAGNDLVLEVTASEAVTVGYDMCPLTPALGGGYSSGDPLPNSDPPPPIPQIIITLEG